MKKSWIASSLSLLAMTMMILCINGCGFHMRGSFCIPKILQTIKICPNKPFDPFQKNLRYTLALNHICVVDECSKCIDPNSINTLPTLTISNDCFSERSLAYGSDNLLNLSLIQFTVTYQITDPNGNCLIPASTIQVERELTINPNAVLGTNDERDRLKVELYMDAISAMLREWSASRICY